MASKKSTTQKSASSTKVMKADLQMQVDRLEKENAQLNMSMTREMGYSNMVKIELEKFAKGLVMTAFALGKFVEERKLAEKVAAMLKEAREEPRVANWVVRNEVHFFADGMNWLFQSLGSPKLTKNAPIEMGTGKELSSVSVWTNTGTVSFTPSKLLGKVVTEATVTHTEKQGRDNIINVENSITFSVELMGALRKFELKSTGFIYSDSAFAYQLSGTASLSVDRRLCPGCDKVHELDGPEKFPNGHSVAAFVDFKKIDIRETET